MDGLSFDIVGIRKNFIDEVEVALIKGGFKSVVEAEVYLEKEVYSIDGDGYDYFIRKVQTTLIYKISSSKPKFTLTSI